MCIRDRRDGSSTAFLYMDELDLEWADGRGTLRIGAGHAETLARMLKARVGKERTLFLQGQETAVQIRPGSKPALVCAEQLPELTLTSKALEELCRLLAPHAGTYSMKAMPLTVELVPTRIMDLSLIHIYRRNVQSKKALCTNTAPHLFIFSTHLLTSRPFFSCCYNSVIIIFHIAVISICT